MSLGGRLAGLMLRLRHPRTTVRWRLTLLYGGLFLVSGAALLAVTYTLVAHATVTRGAEGVLARLPNPPANFQVATGAGNRTFRGPPPPGFKALLRSPAGKAVVTLVGSRQRIADLHQLEVESGIALAIMAILSAALGWLVAGRVLRPLRTISATTQQISEANLHQRLALQGPRDELRGLADTIDGLLGRLEGAFNAQRRFVANASHELRTPLTAARALLEMVLSDPHATIETFREACRDVLEESERQEQLINALLALAQGQRGLDRHELIDIAAITGDVLPAHGLDAAARGVQLNITLEPAFISGDRRLIERLVSNLLENAIRYNHPSGHVRVRVGTKVGRARLTVANTGPFIPADEVQRLLQPFQRLTPDRLGQREGLGLGLSIVAAIADAHGATLEVRPGETGGLEIEVSFAAAADDSGAPTPDDGLQPVTAPSVG